MATLVDTAGQTTDYNMGLGKFETRLGDDVVTEGFARELERYSDKAELPGDQNKCLQLLASLRFGGDTKKNDVALLRPKTAMAALGIPDIRHVTRPYETTYKREYVPRPDPEIRAVRPKTSQGFVEPDTIPQAVRNTTYDEEYYNKPQRPSSPIRSGTASGNRNNKPHPTKNFLVWKFPSKTQPFPPGMPWSEELTNEKLNQVTKRQYRSTYQNDYLGIPQGFQVKSAFNLPPDWKERVPYTLHSFQRSTYRPPQQQPELVVPTNRYGANRNKHLASSGVIPSSNLRSVGIKTRTTYDRHYNDLAPAVAQQALDPTGRLGGALIRAQHEKAFVEEAPRDTRSRLMEDTIPVYREGSGVSVSPAPPATPSPPSYTRPSVPTPARARPMVPAATPITNYGACQNIPVPAPPCPSSALSVPYSPPLFLG